MRSDFFADLYRRLDLAPSHNIGIYRLDGAVVVRRLGNFEGEIGPSAATDPLITDYFPKASSGTFEAVSPIDHVRRLGAYRGVEGWPLIVASLSERDAVLAPWRIRAERIAAAAAAAVIALAMLTWWGHRRIQGEARARMKNGVLLNEVHHRVRNNLAIIQSLLALEANLAPSEARQGYDKSIARVEAMALVHELLYQSQDFAGIDAAAYLQRLADNLQTSAPDNVEITSEAEAINIDLDTAIPAALVINELVINAVKHGFPAGGAGRVAVGLRRNGGHAVLTVADDGVGLAGIATPNRGKGLGLMLVYQLTKQLGGTLSTESRAGTTFTLTFPLRPAPG